MTSPQQLEILDLRHFSAKQLRPLLVEESGVWQRRLSWDYRASTSLLLDYLDSRILPGFVALDRGRVCGYTFCVYEGSKAVVGDVYTHASHPTPMAVNHTLTRHLLDTLEASPDITRIEAQLLLFDSGSLRSVFGGPQQQKPGFRVFPRLFLHSHLQPVPSPVLPAHFNRQFELCQWLPALYEPVAELIRASYVGHIDSDINDQYKTLAGAQRFLHNIVRFPGCGTFDAGSSWLLRDRATQALAAVVLCSRVAPDIAHITQLCVAPAYRGRRLGRLLLSLCMAHLPTARYRALTLTVTEANTSAMNLYRAAGFACTHRFDALVLNKQPHRLRLL